MMSRLWMLLVVGACTTTAPAVEPIFRCSVLLCGANSPEVDHYGFHDLNLDHLRNDAGFVVVGLTQDRIGYELEVRNDAIRGIAPKAVIEGGALTGAQIWLQQGTKLYAIEIESVGLTASVVKPYDELETYVLVWSQALGSTIRIDPGQPVDVPTLDSKRTRVCAGGDEANGISPDYWSELERQWDPIATALKLPYESIVFEGDRIDAEHRTVDTLADDRWFNIGCGRHTLTKLRLTRSTLHTTPSNSWRQVQTTLKMLSADYCGTGMSFTVAGQPLVWRNEEGMGYWKRPQGLEARWNEYGAICLDTPRVAASSYPPALARFSDVEREIAAECVRPPPCTSSDPDRFDSPDERITTGIY